MRFIRWRMFSQLTADVVDEYGAMTHRSKAPTAPTAGSAPSLGRNWPVPTVWKQHLVYLFKAPNVHLHSRPLQARLLRPDRQRGGL
jgi:hypothetical protein